MDQQPLLSTEIGVDISRLATVQERKGTALFFTLAKWVLKTTMGLLFITWVCFYFFFPSTFMSNFLTYMEDVGETTAFGVTGAYCLLFCCPILLIGVLAFPYLIISEKEQQLQEYVCQVATLVLIFIIVCRAFAVSLPHCSCMSWRRTGCSVTEASSHVFILLFCILSNDILYFLSSCVCCSCHSIAKEKSKAPRLRLWTFPVLVDGPFGVVNAVEFIGILLFAVFVIWATIMYAIENYNLLDDFDLTTGAERRAYMVRMTAYTFGLMGLVCLAFLFLPIARGSVLLRLIDIPFEHAVKYHIWLGHLTMILLTIHGLGYVTYWLMAGIFWTDLVEWKSDGGANLAGVIGYFFGFLMWMTSMPPVRKKNFQLFYYTHHFYVLFIIFMALHTGDYKFSIAAGGIFIFMLDRFLRFWQSKRTVDIISATSFPCGSVELVLSKPKNLQYSALGFIFLHIRELSRLQWHPFSVSSSPLVGKNHLSVVIKAIGDWTQKLQGVVTDASSEEPTQFPSKLSASVEGPYGHESPYHLMYESLILVAGGSGISPFLAILSDILYRKNEGKPCLPRNIVLIWAVKRSNELPVLYATDMESICPKFSNKLNIEILTYVTRESQLPLEEGNAQEAIKSSICPVNGGHTMSMLVGTGSIIWSGAYFISSTAGLIVSLTMLDVFYINPYGISYWWYKALLFLACMVLSVVIFGGFVVVLWHHWEIKISRKEESEDRDNKTDTVLHGGYLSQDNLISMSTVHYGRRPNFKDIFDSISERWGRVDVGVIVCGPPSIEASVAKECRSQNLQRISVSPVFHFNSHSFDL